MKPIKALVSGEPVYLVNSKLFGWGVVHPNKNEDGTWNWKNFLIGGNWPKFIAMIVILLIVLGLFFEHATFVKVANECLQQLNNPWYLNP